MKALGKLKKEPGLWLHDAAMPVCKKNEILVKIKKTSICGTDLHIYKWDKWAQNTITVPMITGHEFVGTIEEIGKDVQDLKIGTRIVGEGHLVCGYCRNCRAGLRHFCSHEKGIGVNINGCFAEYITIPASNAILIPDSISDEVASCLDALGNAIHTAHSFDLVGEDVLVTGAGPIGIMSAVVAKHLGARIVIITDTSDYRLSLAQKLGIQYAVNVERDSLQDLMKKLEIREGFSIGLEMSGNSSAFNQMLKAINYGGKIALLGILPDGVGIPWTHAIFHGFTLKCVYGRQIYDTWYKMLAMLESGLDIANIVTHSLDHTDFTKGFELSVRGLSGKVVLDWG